MNVSQTVKMSYTYYYYLLYYYYYTYNVVESLKTEDLHGGLWFVGLSSGCDLFQLWLFRSFQYTTVYCTPMYAHHVSTISFNHLLL